MNTHTEPLPDCVRRLAILEASQEALAGEIARARESSGRMEMTANTLAITLGRLEKVAERYEGMVQRMHDAEVAGKALGDAIVRVETDAEPVESAEHPESACSGDAC